MRGTRERPVRDERTTATTTAATRTPASPQARLQRAFGNRALARAYAAATAPAEGPGRPLPPPVRATMEHAYAADFADVRVHEGPRPAALGAEAFARGHELHFAPGRYDPRSRRGLELIGHELAHVVQQRSGALAGGARDDRRLEAQADAWSARAVRGERVPTPRSLGAAGPHAVQRKISLEHIPPGLEKAFADGSATFAGLDALAAAVTPELRHKVKPRQLETMFLQWHIDAEDHKFADLDELAKGFDLRLARREDVDAFSWGPDLTEEKTQPLGPDQHPTPSDEHEDHKETEDELSAARQLALTHPERNGFFAAMEAFIDEKHTIEHLWDLTIRGIVHQRRLNAAGLKKVVRNSRYEELAEALAPHLQAGDRPALWAGGFAVSAYAQAHGYCTLEATRAGLLFDRLKLYKDFSTLGPLWNGLSRKFVASCAQREVHVFLRSFDPDSVLVRQELDELAHLRSPATRWHILEGTTVADLKEIAADGTPVDEAALTDPEVRQAYTAMLARGVRAAVLRLKQPAFRSGDDPLPPPRVDELKEEAATGQEQLRTLARNARSLLYASKLREAELLRQDPIGRHFAPEDSVLEQHAAAQAAGFVGRLHNDPAVLLGLVNPATLAELARRLLAEEFAVI